MTAVAMGLIEGLGAVNLPDDAKVDGIFVLCFRASDNTCGGAIHAPAVPIDSMIGMVVSILGKIRIQRAEEEAVAVKAASSGTTS